MATRDEELALASNPKTSAQKLSELLHGGDRDIALAVAANPSASQKALRKLVNHDDPMIRSRAATNPSAGDRIREIYDIKARNVREAAEEQSRRAEEEAAIMAAAEPQKKSTGEVALRLVGRFLAACAFSAFFGLVAAYFINDTIIYPAAGIGFFLALVFPDIWKYFTGPF